MNKVFKSIVRNIPNALTSLNLLSGSLAVLFALQEHLQTASILIIAAYVFDILDGLLARMLNVQSLIGKELDSLADLVSFGLAPACILFGIGQELSGSGPVDFYRPVYHWIVSLVPFILPVFAGLRLANFNIDERQTEQFIGLPTPSNGVMVLALPLVLAHQPESFLTAWMETAWFIPTYSVVVSYLMVSPVPLYSLKVKGLSIRRNWLTYFSMLVVLVLVVTMRYTGIFLIIPLYFVFGALAARFIKK
jgi:CDP-diacylglycerol--serine O-phosphatidyltransferase